MRIKVISCVVLKEWALEKNCLGLNLGSTVSLGKLPIYLSFLIWYLPHNVLRIKLVHTCEMLRLIEQ